EDGGASRSDERERPLRRGGRLGERLRDRDPEAVGLLLLGATVHDCRVRRRMLPQELALAAVRLEQRHLALRKCERERDPGGAPARADVYDRALVTPYELEPAQRVVEQRAPRLLQVVDRRQARRGDDRA